jgi:hypothetical protein
LVNKPEFDGYAEIYYSGISIFSSFFIGYHGAAMEWKIEYLPDEKILYVKTNGLLTARSANLMVKEIVEAANCHQCDKQVVDHRETFFAFSLLEYYERPEINAKIGISYNWKIAMVFRELSQDTYFMETVFKNRGYNFRQFDDIEKAYMWVLA